MKRKTLVIKVTEVSNCMLIAVYSTFSLSDAAQKFDRFATA
jgi:hypothetical protein